MTRFILLPLILFAILVGSCSGRKNKMDDSSLIPEKEFVSILADIYLADGLLTLPKTHQWLSSLDTLSTYYKIIEKHGFTKEKMDITLKYYFIKSPMQLIKIYDQVLGILSEMESIVEKEEILAESHRENLWKGIEFISFPDTGGTDSAHFTLTLDKPGRYSLLFSVTLFPDDQSINPRITVYSCHPDSLETGKKNYVNTLKLLKDGNIHNYSLIIRVAENKPVLLKGCFYDHDNYIDEWEKHVIFNNISLTFISPYL